MTKIELDGELITEAKIQRMFALIEQDNSAYGQYIKVNADRYRRDIGKYKTVLVIDCGSLENRVTIALVFKTKNKGRSLEFETLKRIIKAHLRDYPHISTFKYKGKTYDI